MPSSRMLRRPIALAGAVAIAAVLPMTALAATSKPQTVNVKMANFKFVLGAKTAKKGKLTFVVKNADKIPHQMVVIQTKLAAGKLPVKNGLASEKGAVGTTKDVKGGKTKSLALTLKPGHYALICNLPG